MINATETPEIVKARDLARRIHARIEEWNSKGAFSDTASTFLKEAEEKCARIDRKLDAAIAKDGFLKTAALEAERDYDSLQLEVARWMDQIAGMR
jgi:hypothetical protein